MTTGPNLRDIWNNNTVTNFTSLRAHFIANYEQPCQTFTSSNDVPGLHNVWPMIGWMNAFRVVAKIFLQNPISCYDRGKVVTRKYQLGAWTFLVAVVTNSPIALWGNLEYRILSWKIHIVNISDKLKVKLESACCRINCPWTIYVIRDEFDSTNIKLKRSVSVRLENFFFLKMTKQASVCRAM